MRRPHRVALVLVSLRSATALVSADRARNARCVSAIAFVDFT
jgi:hypothetical protein